MSSFAVCRYFIITDSNKGLHSLYIPTMSYVITSDDDNSTIGGVNDGYHWETENLTGTKMRKISVNCILLQAEVSEVTAPSGWPMGFCVCAVTPADYVH